MILYFDKVNIIFCLFKVKINYAFQGMTIMGIHGLTVIPFILSGHSFYNSLNIQLSYFLSQQ